MNGKGRNDFNSGDRGSLLGSVVGAVVGVTVWGGFWPALALGIIGSAVGEKLAKRTSS